MKEAAAAPGRPKQGAAPSGGREPHKVGDRGGHILVVKMSSLGDVIQAIPVVSDILAQYPAAQIDWVVEEAFAPLLARVTGLRRVLPIAQRRWRHPGYSLSNWKQIRVERSAFRASLHETAYDAVLDVQGLVKSALVARLARLVPGGFRATFGNRSQDCGWEWPVRYLLDKPVAMDWRIHAVQRYRQLAARALGYAHPALPHYGLQVQPVPGEVPARTVLLVHGTTRADNEWPASDWIALGIQLAGAGWHLALPQASAAEQQRAQQIAQAINQTLNNQPRSDPQAKSRPAAEVWPRLPLVAVMDRMAACAGVIGIDTGLSHLAVALNLPHVQIFSQPRIFRAGPLPSAHQLAVGGDAAPGVATVREAWQRVTQAALDKA